MSIAIIYIAYVIIGAIAGILGGMLGIGGGVVTVPCLLVLFTYLDFPQPYVMHMAVATSLAAMIFNTGAATWAHNKKQGIVWDVFMKLVPGLVVGSIVGAFFAAWLSGVVLEIFFGIFLLLLALNFYRQKAIHVGSHKLPNPLVLNGLSGSIGALSNLLGIGGGSMTVPMLSFFKMRDKNAIGTSAATTLVTTICGTVSYLFLGRGVVHSPETFGLINLPAFFIVGIAAFFLAPYGAKLTHQIDPNLVRRIFAVVLAVTGLSLII
ncbi:MAG: sulfite exporter TauE/SafE family protein [Verrucomicrobia bacterium]|nr:sulfite exporter TauE/SafE family protein [Verrucomicrobiota bacterium]